MYEATCGTCGDTLSWQVNASGESKWVHLDQEAHRIDWHKPVPVNLGRVTRR